jgi:hypothetical protein
LPSSPDERRLRIERLVDFFEVEAFEVEGTSRVEREVDAIGVLVE